MKKRTFPIEFKMESASLVVDKGYSVTEACKAVGVSDSAMRKWVKQLKAERGGQTPQGSKALTPEHQRVRQVAVIGSMAKCANKSLAKFLNPSIEWYEKT